MNQWRMFNDIQAGPSLHHIIEMWGAGQPSCSRPWEWNAAAPGLFQLLLVVHSGDRRPVRRLAHQGMLRAAPARGGLDVER